MMIALYKIPYWQDYTSLTIQSGSGPKILVSKGRKFI